MVQGPPELARPLAEKYPRVRRRRRHLAVRRPARGRRAGSTAARPCWSPSARRGSTSASSASSPTTRSSRSATSACTLDSRYDGPGTADAEADRGRVSSEHAQVGRASSRTSPATTTSTAPPGATFVGAETCKSCHPNTFAKWATTKHAQAFERHRQRPEGPAERPPVRRRVRQLPHDRLRVHLGLEVRRRRPPTSRATSARTATARPRSTSTTPTTPSSARRSHLHRRRRPTRTGSASAATTRTTRPSSTSPSTGARSSTRGSTTTTTPKVHQGHRPPRWPREAGDVPR